VYEQGASRARAAFFECQLGTVARTEEPHRYGKFDPAGDNTSFNGIRQLPANRF
jgi:hypothetical protein